jgi:uracil-DNA glycosylase family 4
MFFGSPDLAKLNIASHVSPLQILQDEITACTLCPRLIEHCRSTAITKRRAYRDQDYWGKPVPSFGDPNARLLILGLAPGAHGANRTGRMFTGDSSGDYLYRVLHAAGFASQPTSRRSDDGLQLRDAYITASCHCAPPDNKPATEEVSQCRDYLVRELAYLTNVQVVVALGKLAHDNYLAILKDSGSIASRASYAFGHNATHLLHPMLIDSYHPSQQNTSTGKLTERMLLDVFENARNQLK